jgi:chromate transporter
MQTVPDDQQQAGVSVDNPQYSSPSTWLMLRVWLGLGLQSFGGGTATLYLIRRAVVERYGWLSDDEFTRSWAVCQIAPGINLVGLTILIGWRLARVRGLLLALLGLLGPSVSITVLMTAVYTRVQGLGLVQAGVRGIIPAAAGLGLLLAQQMARPLLRDSWHEGRASLAVSVVLLLGSVAVASLTTVSVIWVIWGAGALGAVFHWYRHGAARRRQGRTA